MVFGATLEVGPGYTYTTIQDAINAASEGDTVLVHYGIYEESVVLSKTLNLIGVEGPIIDGGGDWVPGIRITAGGCTVRGFNIKNAFLDGIHVESDNNVIRLNIISNCGWGIRLWGSHWNVVTENNCTLAIGEVGYGIELVVSQGNRIYYNYLDWYSEFSPETKYNAKDDSDQNTWYNTTTNRGNTYSDYYGEDLDEDGVGDTPYPIAGDAGAEDPYPLMPPTPPTRVAPTITSAPSVSEITSSGAKVSWGTDQQDSNHRVIYGLEPDLSDGMFSSWVNGTDFPQITLTGLGSDETIYYRCVSYNGYDDSLYVETDIDSFATLREPRTWHVDDDLAQYPDADHTTIQEAVDEAVAGDTIIVHEGVYVEDIIIDKTLTVTGVNYPEVMGEAFHAVTVNANSCVLEHLNITAGYYDAVHLLKGHTTITDCHIHRSLNGVYIGTGSNSNTVEGCDLRKNGQGVYTDYADYNTITDSYVYSNGKGIVLSSSDQNTIQGCVLVNNSAAYGIQMGVQFPMFETISGNRVEGSELINNALRLVNNVVDTVITGNTLKLESHPDEPIPWGYDGIYAGHNCLNLEISHNIIEGKVTLYMSGHSGILLDSVASSTLTGNTVKWMYQGVTLIDARDVTMRDNALYENSYNFHIGMNPSYSTPIDTTLFEHDIDTSNTVEEKPIHYYVNQNDLSINDPDIGFLAVVNGQNIQVEGLYPSKNSQGILFVNVDGATIDGCYTWDNHLAGVALMECSNMEVRGCSLKNNGDYESYAEDLSSTGLVIIRGEDNTVTGCDASNNERIGIELFNTQGNTITGCQILDNGVDEAHQGHRGTGVSVRGATGNVIHTCTIAGEVADRQYYGVWLDSATSGNTIYNNIFDNDVNAVDLGGEENWNMAKTPGSNIIDGPYLGGNNWSDYPGGDLDFDGIGDTELPYTSDGSISTGGDWLPLTDNWLDDGNPPTFTLTSPLDGSTITRSWVEIKVSSPDPDVKDWWYSLDGGPDTSFTPGETTAIVSGLSPGDHVLDIYVDDVFGNTNSVTVRFRYVQPAPIIGDTPSKPALDQVQEEAAQFKVTIKSPTAKAYTSRSLEVLIEAPYILDRVSYRLDDGPDVEMTGLASALSRLTVGAHTLVVSAESETGLLGRGEVTFAVEPLSLGEAYQVGAPDYVDDVVFTFNGRLVDCLLSFEARRVSEGDLSIHVNSVLTGQPPKTASITSIQDLGVALGNVPETVRWERYTYRLNASMVVPDSENLLSFIHNVNPSRITGTLDWMVRNVTVTPISTFEFPAVEVWCSPKSVGVDGRIKPSIRVEGVAEAESYDLYLYLVTPEGEILYYPEWTSEPTALNRLYLKTNHYGALPGWFTATEDHPQGTYRAVAKITHRGQAEPVSLSTDRFYYSGEASVKLFTGRGLHTDGDKLHVSYAVTAPTPFNGTLLVHLERPDGARVYLPAYTSVPYSTPLEPASNLYETAYEDTIDGSWVNGTYILRASLFESNGALVDDDLVLFTVSREPLTVTGAIVSADWRGVIYSRLSLYDAATLKHVTTLETEGPHSVYSLTAAAGSYILTGEAVTDIWNYYTVKPVIISYSYGEPVRHDILLGRSTGKLEPASPGLRTVGLHNDAKQHNLLPLAFLDTPIGGLREVQDGSDQCPRPKVFLSADIHESLLHALLEQYPGDDAFTLKRYFTAQLANQLKASNPELDITSYSEVVEGLAEMEALIVEGREVDTTELGAKVNAEYLLSLSFRRIGETSIAYANLYDVDLARVINRQEVQGDPLAAIRSVAGHYVDLADVIRVWEINHPVPPRGPRIIFHLSRKSVTLVQGENQITITATVTNCRGQPVEGLLVYFRDTGSAVSGGSPQGRVAAERDLPGIYCVSVTDAEGSAQSTYTLLKGLSPGEEKVDVYVVGRGSKKTHLQAEFSINGISIEAWAEKPSLSPLQATIVYVKLIKVEEGVETPLTDKRIKFERDGIMDGSLVPLSPTEAGLLVTDGSGQATLRFTAGEREGQAGIKFTYDAGVDDPQWPGHPGDKVSEKTIIEVKKDEYIVKLRWVEEYIYEKSYSYVYYRAHPSGGSSRGFYRFGLAADTLWDRRAGREDTVAKIAYLFHEDYYFQYVVDWKECLYHTTDSVTGLLICGDFDYYYKNDYRVIPTDSNVFGEYSGVSVNTLLRTDALGNIYLNVNPVRTPFTLGGYHAVNGEHWWNNFYYDKQEYEWVPVGGGSEKIESHHDYDGFKYQPSADRWGSDVMLRPLGDRGSTWIDDKFRGFVKLEKIGESSYKPFTYRYTKTAPWESLDTKAQVTLTRTITLQVVKR